jgi:hypothetical protein
MRPGMLCSQELVGREWRDDATKSRDEVVRGIEAVQLRGASAPGGSALFASAALGVAAGRAAENTDAFSALSDRFVRSFVVCLFVRLFVWFVPLRPRV